MEEKKSKRENIAEDGFAEELLKRMLQYNSLSMEETLNPLYRFNNTLTREQYSQFKEEGIEMIQKALKINKRKAISAFNWFYNNFGLRIKG